MANVQSKVGVSLERLTLISGEGHEDKKITAGLLAGAATLLSMRAGGGIGGAGGIDFADREPIEDHLSKDDARRIGEEALAIVVEKLRAAGVAVDGPEKVAAAPFMAEAKGESEVSTDSAQDKGSLFRKAYYYGFYCTPVAGLKYRKPGMFEGMGDSDYYPKARAAAGAPGALDLTIAFYNDKKVFGLHEFQARHAKEAPAMLERLKGAVIGNENVFAVLIEAVRCCSLGQITNALFEVGGQYRRSM